mmetsp:Transcript_41418/g.97347  ORF Transcript_41418/g.97347 Transcript_41418/m.97347 type:complete len:227 (+) Transcript_41418:785-1465(+)
MKENAIAGCLPGCQHSFHVHDNLHLCEHPVGLSAAIDLQCDKFLKSQSCSRSSQFRCILDKLCHYFGDHFHHNTVPAQTLYHHELLQPISTINEGCDSNLHQPVRILLRLRRCPFVTSHPPRGAKKCSSQNPIQCVMIEDAYSVPSNVVLGQPAVRPFWICQTVKLSKQCLHDVALNLLIFPSPSNSHCGNSCTARIEPRCKLFGFLCKHRKLRGEGAEILHSLGL